MEGRCRVGAVVKLEQPTGGARIEFPTSDACHVTVWSSEFILGTSLCALILLVFENRDCILSVYCRARVLGMSSTHERALDLFCTQVCYIPFKPTPSQVSKVCEVLFASEM